ncbi:branched-chain amino acid ABC transporter permease [Herbaspirillum sp. BH-1]|uniref:Branched-chain amino acid transport system permease protein n=1 Tax=Herbaspirillum frisingense TaxID=92645 RepID=A0ABU1PFG6_9BURK|nr:MULTISPECIES: branched-chain amino acid ABC transporter permease [Herbaspirillum]MCI1012327.1 branched-chain amino acid ABC transporter permease [Herbaspirillum sp. C7C2]MDR6584519.1 branched-chain amino acid transport system permease protein [Herbaspirillum frisingense]PLY58268.1 branched-chain amino acid ABC transporter permease [Herbaspirillum sp. BH-1]UIN20977.1 branched-chain amino acid ABC transporter permease [Herbaspirillum frisingense]HZG22441.1 branched-chain amino acid ABC transp
MLLLQLLINGVQVGALYALIAVGFSLIFGSTRIFHFAHGSTFTIAAYVFYDLLSIAQWHWSLAVLASAAAAVLFGLALNRFVYVPIQKHEGSFFTVFVASFGVGIVVQNLCGMLFGRSFVAVSTPLSRSVEWLPGLYVSPLAGIAIVIALLFFFALQLFLMRTHTGMAMRALSENPELVRAYGLSPRRLSMMVFALGSLLVVPAALLSAAGSGLNPAIGHHVMLISLAATIVGGVGSLRGAACAGLLLGLAENLALAWFEPQWSEAITFIVLFLFILFRPSGFFGRVATS